MSSECSLLGASPGTRWNLQGDCSLLKPPAFLGTCRSTLPPTTHTLLEITALNDCMWILTQNKTYIRSRTLPRLWRGSYTKSLGNLHPVFYHYLCFYQTSPPFPHVARDELAAGKDKATASKQQNDQDTPRKMIKYLKWYKRDIKINCREKFHTKGCYFFRTNSMIFDCDSLLKEMVQSFVFFLRNWESERACRVWRGCWDAARPGKWTDWCIQSPSLKLRCHHNAFLS